MTDLITTIVTMAIGAGIGYAVREPQMDRLTAERDEARAERDSQAGALKSLAAAADEHGKRLAARAQRAAKSARQQAIGIREVLRDVPVETDACKAAFGLLDRYARAARSVRNTDAAPDPDAGSLRDGDAQGAAATDGDAAG